MKYWEIPEGMIFEFVSDIVIDSTYAVHFEDSAVTDVADLLKEHGITRWQISTGYNPEQRHVVKITVYESTPQAFHYDLTDLMLRQP